MDITFLLNGETVNLESADPSRMLLGWLRETRGLTGTKEGCNEGDCGACTVIVRDEDGTRPLNACILMLGQLQGKSVITIEGLAGPDGEMHPIQTALVDHHASQCGFCTPGIAMTLAAAQINGERDFDTQLAGNLCRCTGYAPIVRAAEAAAMQPVPAWLDPAPADEAIEFAGPSDSQHPQKVDDLADLLMERPHATLVAGATVVALSATKGLAELPEVIFLGRVAELRQTSVTKDTIRIGAGVSIEALRRFLSGHHPHFAAMLKRFGSAQIRPAATLAGNIATGSPVADTVPPLIALGARLHLRRSDVRRVIALEDFFITYGRQDLQPGEFIEAISFRRQPDRLRVYKLTKRFDQDITAVLGAFNIAVEDGTVTSARIAYGGMAGVPKRAHNTEAALLHQPWSRASVETAQGVLDQDFTPIDDLRASASYRMQTARNMLLRVWFEDQGEGVNVQEVLT
jgi:xanthine dehydrogenase small subunit